MATIQDMVNGTNLVPGVIPKLRYRSSVAADAPRWIVSAIRNITDRYTFEELSMPGPQVNLVAGQFVYPVSYFTNSNTKVTRFDSFTLWLTQTTPNIPPSSQSTSVALELKWRAIKTVKAYTTIFGQPIYYNVYSEQPQIEGSAKVWIAFCPNQNYLVQACYQRKHPFTDGLNDVIYLPDAWLEVVACAAALIGAEENAMSDIIQLMKINLYGDPSNTAEPGLVKFLVSSRAQMSNVNERQLTFIAGESR